MGVRPEWGCRAGRAHEDENIERFSSRHNYASVHTGLGGWVDREGEFGRILTTKEGGRRVWGGQGG